MTTAQRLCTHYDPTVDALVIFFRRHARSARTEPLDDNRLVDYDADGGVAFVELLNVSRGTELAGLPEQDRVREELERLGFPVRR